MEGFDGFFAEEYAGVVRSLAVALGDREAAEESAQEAFARAYRKWRAVSVMDRPVAWVYVVALHHAIDGRRRAAREAEIAANDEGPTDGTNDAVLDGMTITAALGCLPARQRQAVVLRYLAALSIEETAQAMRCEPGTVKSTVHAALHRLRVVLPDEADDGP